MHDVPGTAHPFQFPASEKLMNNNFFFHYFMAIFTVCSFNAPPIKTNEDDNRLLYGKTSYRKVSFL